MDIIATKTDCFRVSFTLLIPNSGLGIHERMVAALARYSVSTIEETSSEIINQYVRTQHKMVMLLTFS